jgi:hypothetical protein
MPIVASTRAIVAITEPNLAKFPIIGVKKTDEEKDEEDGGVP